MSSCSQKHCHVPEVPCNEGHFTAEECPYYKGGGESTSKIDETGAWFSFPWTGNSLGLDDLHLITSHAKPDVISLVGLYSAGKTTLLAVSYLLLFNGLNIGRRGFAGSYTLNGWEQISSFLKFEGHQSPAFPPHTPLGLDTRAPGLLHLALRNEDSRQHLFITDPPGEWFEKWSINAEDPAAEGARWGAQFGSLFVFLVDCNSLAGANATKARYDTLMLAERLASVCGKRPVAIVWTKSDIKVNQSITASMIPHLANLFVRCEHFRFSVKKGDEMVGDFDKLWSWIFANLESHPPAIDLPAVSTDSFLGHRVLSP